MQRRSFMKLLASGATVAGTSSLLGACGGGGAQSSESQTPTLPPLAPPRVRFVNLCNNTPFQAAIYEAGTTNIVPTSYGTLPFSSVTPYQPINSRVSVDCELTNNLGTRLLRIQSLSLLPNVAYTVVVFLDRYGELGQTVLTDTALEGAGVGSFGINTLLASSALVNQSYSFYLTPLPIGGATVAIGDDSDLIELAATTYAGPVGVLNELTLLPENNYRIRIASGTDRAGTVKQLLFDSGDIGIAIPASKNIYSLLIYTIASATLPTVLLIEANSGTVQIISNQLTNLRFVHGVPNSKSLVQIGNGVASLNEEYVVTFGTACPYLTMPVGGTTLTLTEASSKTNGGSPYFVYTSAIFQGGHDYCVYSIGNGPASGEITAFVVEDDNTFIADIGNLSIACVNATPIGDVDPGSGLSTGKVDAIANMAVLATGIETHSTSMVQREISTLALTNPSSIEFTVTDSFAIELGQSITPGTNYTFIEGGQSQTISVPSLVPSGIYTLALLGANGNYMTLLYQTNQS